MSRTPEQKAKRQRWEVENRWRYQDQCPRCGGPKWKRKRFCWHCRSFDTSSYRSYGEPSGDGDTVA